MSCEDGQVSLCVDSQFGLVDLIWPHIPSSVSAGLGPGKGLSHLQSPEASRASIPGNGAGGRLSRGVRSRYPGCATELLPSVLGRDALWCLKVFLLSVFK